MGWLLVGVVVDCVLVHGLIFYLGVFDSVYCVVACLGGFGWFGVLG